MAELYRDQEMIRFVWGESCDVPEGQVRMCHYHYNKTPQNYLNQTVGIEAARRYWNNLIEIGFRRMLDDYSHVPEVYLPHFPIADTIEYERLTMNRWCQ